MHRCIVCTLVLLIGAARAAIDHTALKADTRRLVHFSESFGFSKHGILELQLKDLKIYRQSSSKAAQASEINYDKFGFFIAPSDADIKLEQEDTPKHCSLPTHNETYGKILFRFNDADVQRLLKSGLAKNGSPAFVLNRDFQFPKGGLLKLHFANCESDTPVSFKARIAMYNLDRRGKKVYLSVGQTELVPVYWSLFALFAGGTIAWAWLLHTTRDQTHKIHVLMLSLGVFKALTLLCEAAKYHYIAATGSPDGWNIAYYIFTSFRGLMFFTVVVLIGTGWSYMKPFLGDRERKILMVVIPLQVFANIAIVVSDEENPAVQDWAAWKDVFHLVDIVCCCAVLFPIVWSIKHLREAAQTDGKAARNMEKLTLFRQFYVMVVVYIYFTRIVVYLLESTMKFEYVYLSTGASELATLAFYVWTAVKFRPHKENPYLKLHQEEIEL